MDTVAISQDGEREREDKSLSMYMKREELDEVNFFQGNTSRHDPTQPRAIRQHPFSLGSSVVGPSHNPHAPLDAGRATATTVVSKRGRTLKKSRRAIDGDVEVSGATSTPRKRKRMQAGKPSTETVDGVEVQEAKHKKKVARPRKTTTLPVSTQPTERLPKVPLEDGLAEEKVVKRRKNAKVPGIVANELADERESNAMPETGVLQEKEAKVKKRIVKPKLDGGEKVKEVKEAKEPKAKTGVTTRRKKQALANGEPQWSLAKPQPSIQLAVGTSSTSRLDDQPVIQPSIWCGSKEELVSALPELSKSVNGVTWLLSPTPVIFVEDRATNGIIVSDLGGDGISFELIMIRDFVCLSDDLVTLADQTVDKSTTTTTTTRGEQQTQNEQLAALSPIRDGCLDSGATGQSELRAPSQGPNTRPIPGSFSNLPPTPILLPPGSKAQDWSTPTRSPDKIEHTFSNTFRKLALSPGHSALGTSSVADHASSGLRAPPVVFPCAVAGPPSVGPSTDPPSRAHASATPVAASSAPRSHVSHVTPSPADVGPPEAIPLTVSPSAAPSPAAGPSAPRRPLRLPAGPGPSRTKQTTSKLPKFKRIAADASPSIPCDSPAPSLPINTRLPIPPSRIDASTSDIHPSLSSWQTKPVPRECPCTRTSVGGNCKRCSEAETQALSKQAPVPTDPPSAPEGDVKPGHPKLTRSTTAVGSPVIPPPPAIMLSVQTTLSPHHDLIESPLTSVCSCSRTRFDRNCKVCNGYVQKDIVSSSSQPSVPTNLPFAGDGNDHHSRLSNTADRNNKVVTDYSTERMSDGHRERPRDPRPPIKMEPAPPQHLWAWPTEVDGQYPDGPLPWIEPTLTASGWALPPPKDAQTPPANLRARVKDPPPPIEIDLDGPHHAGPSTSDTTGPNPAVTQPQSLAAPVDPRPDELIPCKLPPEVVAICDAYIAGTPILAIVARAFLLHRWRIAVPEECCYAYLGFFKVTSLQERRMVLPDGVKTLEVGQVGGRMEWRFGCTWVPSGEEVLSHGDPSTTSLRPWWSPTAPAIFPAAEDEEDTNTTSPHYLAQHNTHPNYHLLHTLNLPLHQRYHTPLPNYMFASPGAGDIPSGWWCGPEGCGRVSFRSMLRHRRCVGVGCEEGVRRRRAKGKGKAKAKAVFRGEVVERGDVEGEEGGMFRDEEEYQLHVELQRQYEGPEEEGEEEKDPEEGYAVELGQLRDRQQAAPVSHPVNVLPGGGVVDGVVAMWGDGMRTFAYVWGPGDEGKRKWKGKETEGEGERRITHVFTGNAPGLQGEAGTLLMEVQIRVQLSRQMGGSNPYFSCAVGPQKGAVAWGDAPECMRRAREVMLERVRVYGEREVGMERMEVVAWVVVGTRKGASALRCAEHPVVLMLLGCEAAITLVPKSGFPIPGPLPVTAVEAEKVTLVEVKVEVVDDDIGVDGDGDVVMGGAGPYTPDLDDPMLMRMEAISLIDADHVEEPTPMPMGHIEAMDVDKVEEPVVKKRAPVKEKKQAVVVTMVHGDVVMLSGDTFEYSIKRFGTSILLMGSMGEG